MASIYIMGYAIKVGEKFRLKDLGNAVRTENGATYIDNDVSIIKQRPLIIQWVPADSKRYSLLMPDGLKLSGLIENNYSEQLGKVVQLERVGYAKLEKEQGLFLQK